MQMKFVMAEDPQFLSFSWHLPGRDTNPWDHIVILFTQGLLEYSVLKSPDVQKLHC